MKQNNRLQFAQFALALITLVYVYAVDSSQTFYVPKTLEDARNLAAFHVYVLAILALCVFTDGPNNKRIAITFAVFALVENYIFAYLWYESGLTGVYVVSWIGVAASIPMYLAIKHNDLMSHYLFQIGLRIPLLKEFCREQINNMFPTKLEIKIVKVVKFYLMVEIAYSLMNIGYGLTFGVPHSGSISQTIALNQHPDFYYIYRALGDLILIYFVFLVARTLIEEKRKEPDYL